MGGGDSAIRPLAQQLAAVECSHDGKPESAQLWLVHRVLLDFLDARGLRAGRQGGRPVRLGGLWADCRQPPEVNRLSRVTITFSPEVVAQGQKVYFAPTSNARSGPA